jgi:hypothetical protein
VDIAISGIGSLKTRSPLSERHLNPTRYMTLHGLNFIGESLARHRSGLTALFPLDNVALEPGFSLPVKRK